MTHNTRKDRTTHVQHSPKHWREKQRIFALHKTEGSGHQEHTISPKPCRNCGKISERRNSLGYCPKCAATAGKSLKRAIRVRKSPIHKPKTKELTAKQKAKQKKENKRTKRNIKNRIRIKKKRWTV